MLTRKSDFTLPCRFPFRFDREAAFALAAVLVTLMLVYSNSFQGEWHFDDFHTIVDNPNIRLPALTWDELKRSFYGPTFGTDQQHITRPLAYASFALNYFFGGTSVTGYHVVNVLIHCLSAVFLFLLVRLTLTLPPMRERYGDVAYPVALLSAFLWAASPLHVHAVTIIVQRMASMAGLVYVSTLYCYARARSAESTRGALAWFLPCGMSALAAFATKENTAVLPIAILLYEFFFIRGISVAPARTLWKWSALSVAVVFVLGLLYTDFTLQRATYEVGVRPFSPLERVLTQGRVLFFYVSLLLYPIPSRLALLHDIEISRGLFEPWTTFAAIAAIVLLLLFAAVKARKYPLLSFAILFFLLNHLVEASVIPLELIYEHRNYIPSMFFFVPVAEGMLLCLDYFSYRRALQMFMAGGFALLLAFQGHTTFERNDIVRSDVHLWLDNVRKAPGLSRPRINLARHYYEAGMYEEAFREFKAAEEMNRDTNLRQVGVASYNLGVYYLYQAEDPERAERQFIKALERFPGYPPAIVGLAKMRLLKGDQDGAWELLRIEAPRHRNDIEMMHCVGLVLLKKGYAKDALRVSARSLELKWDDPQLWEISGEAWRQLGQQQKAAQCWEEALRLNPSNPRAMLALIDLYDRSEDSPALARMTLRCIALKGAQPLEEWLGGLTRNSALSVYEVNPEKLSRIIRKAIGRDLGVKTLSCSRSRGTR